jgi:hypothetical protein
MRLSETNTEHRNAVNTYHITWQHILQDSTIQINVNFMKATMWNTAVGMRHTGHVAPSIREKLALASPKGDGRSVGIVRSRTKAKMLLLLLLLLILIMWNSRPQLSRSVRH